MKNQYITLSIAAILATQAHAGGNCTSQTRGLAEYLEIPVQTSVEITHICVQGKGECTYGYTKTSENISTTEYELSQMRKFESSAELNTSYTAIDIPGISAAASATFKTALEEYKRVAASDMNKTTYGEILNLKDTVYKAVITRSFNNSPFSIETTYGQSEESIKEKEMKGTLCVKKDFFPIVKSMLNKISNVANDKGGPSHDKASWNTFNFAARAVEQRDTAKIIPVYMQNVAFLHNAPLDNQQWSQIANAANKAKQKYDQKDTRGAVLSFLQGFTELNTPNNPSSQHNGGRFNSLKYHASYLIGLIE